MRIVKLLAGLIAIAALAVVAAANFTPSVGAAQSAINTLGTDGVAIKGYDPVAYFTEGAPHKGKPEFVAEHKGVKWHFASAENKALFEADPEKYTPAYGGFCAYGVSQGYLVKIEPDAWAIRDGTLYLNYDKSVQTQWAEKPAEYIAEADRQWPALIAKK
jgi:YHS domain-containing protein